MNRTKNEFELDYRHYMENGGHSYDPYDIKQAWLDYQKDPKAYDWLGPSTYDLESQV